MFGTDGIRGYPYKGYFTKESLIKIGYSFGAYLLKNNHNVSNVFISKDTRETSDFVEANIIKGINLSGLNTISLGILPTSSLSIFTNKYPHSAGAMITASHNNFEYNGIKFINKKGEKISSVDEKIIEKIYKKKIIHKKTKTLNLTYKDSGAEYVNEIASIVSNLKLPNFKFCIDLANGASYKTTKSLLERLDQDFLLISVQPNGININKNCGVEHLIKVGDYVKKRNLDFGVSIDGDADRVVFVNKNGKLIEGDKIIAFIAESSLKRGSKLITTIMSNNIIEKRLKKRGIEVLRSDVGDKNVYQMMKKENASFGGENSGHYIIKDLLNTSDANITLIYILSLLFKRRLDFDYIDRIKLNSNVLNSYNIVKKKTINKILGMKKFIKEFNTNFKSKGYMNIRYSGTEDKIRLLIQGLNRDDLKIQINKFETIIKDYNES